MPTFGPISGAVSCHSGCSVAGFSSKRLFPPLTVARLHSAPSLHGHYPLLRYYELSDSRKTNMRASQVPRLIYPHAPPPTTPESLMAAFTRCFTTNGRLHPLRQTDRSRKFNEAASGSL